MVSHLYNDCFDNFHFTGPLMACLFSMHFCKLDYTLSALAGLKRRGYFSGRKEQIKNKAQV